MKYVVINDRVIDADEIDYAELWADEIDCANGATPYLRLRINGQEECVIFEPMATDEARCKLEEIVAAKNAATVPEHAQQDSDNDRMKTIERLERMLANLEAAVERLLNK